MDEIWKGEKECEICGIIFKYKHAGRKYCDECKVKPEKSKAALNKAIVASKYRMGEYTKLRIDHCRSCGREMHTRYGREFCNEICREIYREETSTCNNCRKLLKDSRESEGAFCSPKCRIEHDIEYAKSKGWYVPCKMCSDLFIKKTENSKYCSVECFNQHVKMTSIPQELKTIPDMECPICKKIFTPRTNKTKTCSRHCADAYNKKVFEESKIEKQCVICDTTFGTVSKTKKTCSPKCEYRHKKQYMSKVFPNDVKSTVKTKKRNDEPLCVDCKQSMKDCEWFSSRYTKKPKGSRGKTINGKVIIVSCPKYISPTR